MDFTHDAYSPLDYKSAAFGDNGQRPGVLSWVPKDHQRRLAAYRVLAALADNIGRRFLPAGLTDEQRRKYREYGHADRIVVGARAALLGDEQTIHVLGADDTDDQDQPTADSARARAALDYLNAWAIDERLWLNLLEAEYDCSRLGDAVWTLAWDPDKQRARVVTYDPGFYFPTPPVGFGGDFTRKVHIAWEETNRKGRTELHRLTWELAAINPLSELGPDGTVHFLHNDDGTPVVRAGDQLNDFGEITRQYAWNDGPSRVTCYFTDAVWDLSDVKGDVFDLSPAKATYNVRERDLSLDFLPVVHVPNTPARREGFGRATLTMVAQLLDDLSGTDTDLAESTALVGNATLVTKGGPAGNVLGGPGQHLDLPLDGSAAYLDVSKNLDALLKAKESQHKDLSINTRLTDAVLGRLDASNAVSGVGLIWSFNPTTELRRELLGVRDEKYPLLLKFVLRMAQGAGLLEAGPTPDAKLLFGSFLPADRSAAVELVAAAVKGRVMSTETAVLYLTEQGFPVEDAVAEVERIRRESFDMAVQLVEATGSVEAAWRFLGIDPPEADTGA